MNEFVQQQRQQQQNVMRRLIVFGDIEWSHSERSASIWLCVNESSNSHWTILFIQGLSALFECTH